MSKKSSRPSRPQVQQPEDEMKLEGNVPTPDAPARITLALYFTHGHSLIVTVDAYLFQRNTRTNEVVGWEFRGMDHRLGFNPKDLVAYSEIGVEPQPPIVVDEEPVEAPIEQVEPEPVPVA